MDIWSAVTLRTFLVVGRAYHGKKRTFLSMATAFFVVAV
jgi:hypothetical protein